MSQSQANPALVSALAEIDKKFEHIETVMVLKSARNQLKILMNMAIPNADHSSYLRDIDDLLSRLEKKDVA